MLFVRSGSLTEISCLMEDFLVWDEVACPPKDSDASTSRPLPASEPTTYSISGNADASVLPHLRRFLWWISTTIVISLSDFCRKDYCYVFPRGNFL